MIFHDSFGSICKRATALAFIALASINCTVTTGGGGGGAPGAGGSSTAGSTTATATTGGGDPACAGPPLCDVIRLLKDMGDNPGDAVTIKNGNANPANTVAARCALQKLRDHDVGSLDLWTSDTGGNGIYTNCGEFTEVVSFGDGEVSVSHRTYCDLGTPGAGPSVRRQLKPQSYFDACLAGDDAGLFPCLDEIATDVTVEGATCPCRGIDGAPPGPASCEPFSGP